MITDKTIMDDFKDIPTSRKEAEIKDSVAYFTGVICKNGHVDKRYTNTGICYACKRAINKRCSVANPETYKGIRARTYISNKGSILQANAEWAKNNPEATRVIKRRNKEKHRARYNKIEATRQRERCKIDKEYRLYTRMSKAIWQFLKSRGETKQGKKWKELVEYSITDLVAHIENQFDNNMSWDNYGSYWHIDHIVPKKYFVTHPLTDKSYLFKCCWSLINLRPLKGTDNASKGASLLDDKTKELIKLFKLEITDEYIR